MKRRPRPSSKPSTPCPHRRGTAPIELVLSLPILLALTVAIIWLGTSVIAQSEVTVTARHKTWSKRTSPTGTALLFLEDDIASETDTGKVENNTIFTDTEPPESSHDLMTGVWDHKKLPLNKAPNWNQYAIAAVNAKTGSVQTNYTDASNKFSQWSGESGNLWNSLGAGLIRQLTSLGDSAKSSSNNKQNDNSDQSKLRAAIDQQIASKRAELSNTKDRIKDLGDQENSKALRKVLKNKVKRLESEIDNLKDDRKAIDE